ncbi:hypothetical protein ACTFIZ_003597 [Dictyostelium cf. discoideum]
MISITNKILRNNQYLKKLIITPSSSLSLVSINKKNDTINRFYIKKPSVSIRPNYDPEQVKSSMGLEGIENLEMELDEKYIEKQLNPKIEKSKREINHKKKIKISPFDIYLEETENFKEPQVDLVDDNQLHVFPPPKKNYGKTSSSRPKQNPIHDEHEIDEIEEQAQISTVNEENEDQDLIIGGRKTFNKEYEEEEDDDGELEDLDYIEENDIDEVDFDEDDMDEDDFMNPYGHRRKRRVHQEDFLPMEARANFLKNKERKNNIILQNKINSELSRRKKLLSEAGFAEEEISVMFPKNQDMHDPNNPSNYITNKVFSSHGDIKKLSLKLYEIDKLQENRTKFNDDAINLKSVQVINVDGTNIGLMSGPKAYRLAYTKKLDIILTFGQNGNVYGRLVSLEDYIKITEKRLEKERERRIDTATKGTKGVIISSNINDNDRAVKFDQIIKFLLKRHSVEITITYKNLDKKDRTIIDINSPMAQDGRKIFTLFDPLVKGIGRVQTNVEKNGLLISRFYQPLTVKEREEHLKRVERKENTEAERLKEKLERDEIDRLYELGLDVDPVQVAASVAASLKRIEIEREMAKENITQAQLDLFEEEEREKERKRKEKEERFKLAPVSGEGLSNKQIKQNKNKNKNLEKKLKKNDDEELF